MGFLTGLVSAIKKTIRLRRMINKLSKEERGSTSDLIKRKLLIYGKGLLKGLLAQFSIFGVIIVVLILSVAVVFQLFGFSVSEDNVNNAANNSELLGDFSEGSLDDMSDWGHALSADKLKEMDGFAESFTDGDVEELQDFGGVVHPKKVPTYFEIEDESYDKNVEIHIPVETTVTLNGAIVEERLDYINHMYRRGDTAYPFRQWYHSTTGLDSLYHTADKEYEDEIIESARIELKPSFYWTDPVTPDYEAFDKYDYTGDLEEINTYITVSNSHYSFKSVNVLEPIDDSITSNTHYGHTGDNNSTRGSGEIIGVATERTSWTDHEVIERVETKPLPFLYTVVTMFAAHDFEYKEEQIITKSNGTFSGSETITETVLVDGEVRQAEFTYDVITEVDYTLIIDTHVMLEEFIEYLPTFYDFLNIYEIDTYADPWVMEMMAEYLPQNYDFINQYSSYLGYIESINEFRSGDYAGEFFEGDFGNFEGGELLYPVQGHSYISSYYGYRADPFTGKRKFHGGIDIPAPVGVDILAAEDGIVTYSGMNGSITKGYGYLIEINHGSDLTTRYGHCSRILVSNGESVSKGQVIGKIGSTGGSTGPHLHFEVRKNGVPTNPLPWVSGD